MKQSRIAAGVVLGAVLLAPPAVRAQTLPTPPEAKGSEHTGSGYDGGPTGYTGTGRSGTVGTGQWDGTIDRTPVTPQPGDTPTIPPGPQGSGTGEEAVRP